MHIQRACASICLMCDGAGEIAGLIDWGDACHSWLVAEAAIAACYMMQLTVRQHPFHSAAALLVWHTRTGCRRRPSYP